MLIATPATQAREKSWLQSLRELILKNEALAPAGTRTEFSKGDKSPTKLLCLISPRIQPSRSATSQEPPTVVVALPQPTLLVASQLAEWQVADEQGNPLASTLARDDQPITGAIALPALQPQQTLNLRLRPFEAGGDDYVLLKLQAASATEQARAQALLQDRRDRMNVVQELLQQGQQNLAMELVAAPLRSPSPRLEELRQLLMREGCRPVAS
ncbi:MAG: hypothetical protein ACKO5F_13790 [Synechococcus sp.]